MTPRDIIKRNLECDGADRIGLDFDGGRHTDFHWGGLGPSPVWKQRRWTENGFEYYDDEWGNLWHRLVGRCSGGEICKPALPDWSALATYRLPEMAADARFAQLSALFTQQPDRYHLAFLPGFPFSICRYLRRLDRYLEDLLLEREAVEELNERVTALLEGVIRQFARHGADGVFFCEDWGLQDRLMIAPQVWREVFKPCYRRLCQAAREAGVHVLMHSCGYNWEILDDLAEVGIRCFQFDQPALYGLDRLAEKLKRLRVCLYAPVDIQKVMPTGDRALIEAEAETMVRLFGGPTGGLIARNYGDLAGIGVQREWDQWAYEMFRRQCRLK